MIGFLDISIFMLEVDLSFYCGIYITCLGLVRGKYGTIIEYVVKKWIHRIIRAIYICMQCIVNQTAVHGVY